MPTGEADVLSQSSKVKKGGNPASGIVSLPERPKLLIVDDEPVNIQILYQIFERDCEVFMATNGPDALQVCAQKSPDLILLDVIMPGMDGIEVCRRLKAGEDTQGIPIIFVTSQHRPDEEAAGLEVGAVDFISKPVSPPVVKARVKTHLTLKAQADALRAMAFIDGLTGVANRRYFDEHLQREWRGCARNQQPIALIMMDIDHFKKFNDYYGHQAGDDGLTAVAQELKRGVKRSHDLVARYGGEEFACLLPATDLAGARAKAEELRKGVEDLKIAHDASPSSEYLTISLGVAVVVPGVDQSPDVIINMADEQLYKAKGAGRNRVAAASNGGNAPDKGNTPV